MSLLEVLSDISRDPRPWARDPIALSAFAVDADPPVTA